MESHAFTSLTWDHQLQLCLEHHRLAMTHIFMGKLYRLYFLQKKLNSSSEFFSFTIWVWLFCLKTKYTLFSTSLLISVCFHQTITKAFWSQWRNTPNVANPSRRQRASVSQPMISVKPATADTHKQVLWSEKPNHCYMTKEMFLHSQ